ncbi:MAG: alpha-glucosidase [Saprospiraceae bacterium]|nr:alpha-glucosidase [Saprospiraceae bacterium]
MTRNWWKESVIYQIYPRSFNDSNGDGIGDLRGIAQKLDYLKELGVDIIWMSPVYQSPNDDNGYDISDYYSIMDEFGDMSDFDELLEGIHKRDMKLVMDLVVNHTSDEHEWFQESRKSPDNPYRDFYHWVEEKPNDWKSIFGGSAWQWDEEAGAYYLHLFTVKQPDLNWENPQVRKEVYKMMRYWLDKGVDGFRMDVIPFISKRPGYPVADTDDFYEIINTVYANGPRVHEFLREMNEEVCSRYDITTIGEGVGINPEQANLYVGEDRNELDMIFHFGHVAIDNGPGGKFDIVDWPLTKFKDIFTTWHEAVGERGWVNVYLDNHDFPRMVSRFGNDDEYRAESAKLLATLILSLRGTPCIYQGSEIGMTNVAFESFDDYRDIETKNIYREYKQAGKDLDELLKAVHRQGRDNQRTPMQWDDGEHAGFTDGTPWIKVNPNHKEINVKDALADPDSIFYYYRKMLDLRKAHPTLIYGEYEVIDERSEELYAYRRWDKGGEYFVCLNFTSGDLSGLPLPDNTNLELLISNYPEKGMKNETLRPWEARVYLAGR